MEKEALGERAEAKACVLVVDDQEAVRFSLREILEDSGYRVLCAERADLAASYVEEADLIISDYAMPKMNGLEFLATLRSDEKELPFLMLTARGNERLAVSALKAGANDYLVKPVDVDELLLTVKRELEHTKLRRENRQLRAEVYQGGFIGRSEPVQRLMRKVEKFAQRDFPVLIRGASGSGKELIAGLIHSHSPRSDAPLVRFNCAALSEELAASELFGHVKGAFSGAHQDREGFFQRADGGSLVLDEVGELPMRLQAMLLRAVQFGEIQVVGSAEVQKVDVRVIACTHRDLSQSAKVSFREDLYYRLSTLELTVPSLSERVEDIPLLVKEIAKRASLRFGMEIPKISATLMRKLVEREWPGQVRELENLVLRMLALMDGDEIGEGEYREALGQPSANASSVINPIGLRAQMASVEKKLVQEALERASWNQSQCARDLGISRVTLIDKMKRHGLGKEKN